MIDAKSLRRGNAVRLCFEHKAGWINAKVTDIYNDGTIDTDCDEVIEGKKYYFEGITLSEDILIKAGFERFHTNPRLENFYIEREGYYPFQVYTNRDGQIFFNGNLKLEYIHDLQNLYYCHQKAELNIQI